MLIKAYAFFVFIRLDYLCLLENYMGSLDKTKDSNLRREYLNPRQTHKISFLPLSKAILLRKLP